MGVNKIVHHNCKFEQFAHFLRYYSDILTQIINKLRVNYLERRKRKSTVARKKPIVMMALSKERMMTKGTSLWRLMKFPKSSKGFYILNTKNAQTSSHYSHRSRCTRC